MLIAIVTATATTAMSARTRTRPRPSIDRRSTHDARTDAARGKGVGHCPSTAYPRTGPRTWLQAKQGADRRRASERGCGRGRTDLDRTGTVRAQGRALCKPEALEMRLR